MKKYAWRAVSRSRALPRGSKYPNSRVLGPKVHTLNGFWTLKPYYLGTWTLWAIQSARKPHKLWLQNQQPYSLPVSSTTCFFFKDGS